MTFSQPAALGGVFNSTYTNDAFPQGNGQVYAVNYTFNFTTSPAQLFTSGADTVDFNNLDAAQQAAIAGGANLYSALEGNDEVTLPDTTNANQSVDTGKTFSGWDFGEPFNAGAGNDTINGRNGNDTAFGGENNDTINGGAGVDVLAGNEGNDAIDGGTGNDTLSGDLPLFAPIPSLEVDPQGDDTLQGGVGNDILFGGGGADRLFGGDDDDTLRGGTGNDTLDGGLGHNAASFSGKGSDYTIYFQTPLNWNVVGPDGTDNAVLIHDFRFANATVTNEQLFQQLVGVEEIAEIKGQIDELKHKKTNIDALIQLCQQTIDDAKAGLSKAEFAANILSLKVVIDAAMEWVQKEPTVGKELALLYGAVKIVGNTGFALVEAGSRLKEYPKILQEAGSDTIELVLKTFNNAASLYSSVKDLKDVNDVIVFTNDYFRLIDLIRGAKENSGAVSKQIARHREPDQGP